MEEEELLLTLMAATVVLRGDFLRQLGNLLMDLMVELNLVTALAAAAAAVDTLLAVAVVVLVMIMAVYLEVVVADLLDMVMGILCKVRLHRVVVMVMLM